MESNVLESKIKMSKMLGINIPNNEFNLNKRDVNFSFGTFNRPEDLNPNSLNIMLDHSFTHLPEDLVIFIDHHLCEQNGIYKYPSNAALICDNYDYIYESISLLIKEINFEGINVYIHNDLDGIASGICFKKILNDIFEGKPDPHAVKTLNFAKIIGNYGDIFPDAKLDLVEYQRFNDPKMLEIMHKKISAYCKTISRFMKATRPIHPELKYLDLNNLSSIVLELNLLLSSVDLNVLNIKYEVERICDIINSMKVVDLKTILIALNLIANSRTVEKVFNLFNEEIERLVKCYIDPTTPAFEMNIVFKEDPTKTVYKLLTIASPFDCGRSVLWKYRSSVQSLVKMQPKESQWYYKVTDWDMDMTAEIKNILCYNRTLKKLSIDSSNNSAYDIAKNIFNGGGHDSIDNGNRSIGSVVVDDEKTFLNSFLLVDFY